MTNDALLDNPSFVLHGVHDTKFEERPVPDVDGDLVLIAIAKTGICGSDVHYYEHGRIGNHIVEDPMCLGHESAGTIVTLGPAVPASAELNVGDRVGLEPGASCRVCDLCKSGLYELCREMKFAATPPSTLGTLCRYYKLPFDLLYKLPQAVSLEQGAMLEPLSVAVHALATLAKLKSGQNVVIFGAGPVGLLCMAVARALGATRIIAVDIQKERLDFAKAYAATDVFLPPARGDDAGDVYANRMATALLDNLSVASEGAGAVNVVIDASGAPACIAAGLHILAPAGTFVQVGMGAPTVPIPMFEIVRKQLKVLGSFRYGQGDYPLAISLVERGLVDLQPLVTHRYPFEQALEAFKVVRSGKDAIGKMVIKAVIDGPK